jgi:hypothetical protein
MWVRWQNKRTGADTKWHWVPTSLTVKASCGARLPSILEERSTSYGEPQPNSCCGRCVTKAANRQRKGHA